MMTLLGGLSPAVFLREYWHKRPLLVRQAVPNFSGPLDPEDLRALAAREDVESRLVSRIGGNWNLEHGPFAASRFRKLGRRDWTLLVQSVDHHLPAGAALLEQFSFIPHARLDDLMVSYASPGGGVGPHFDSYDVFLLQGLGHRRWRIAAQKNLDIVKGLPLKILKRFKPSAEYVLGPGDMLYLPPHFAHDGLAEDDCMTWSIGFRAPSTQELAQAFVDFLRDRIELPGRYADSDLALQKHPAEISLAMLAQIEAMVSGIRWDRKDIAEFAGEYLSEPKPHVLFNAPDPIMGRKVFGKSLASRGAALDAKTRMLFSGRRIFINGETLLASGLEGRVLRTLADSRKLPPQSNLPAELQDMLYDWYEAGWLGLGPARAHHA
ncbi:MAG: cupin domain-containing protein [Thiobacillaceae bacterium]